MKKFILIKGLFINLFFCSCDNSYFSKELPKELPKEQNTWSLEKKNCLKQVKPSFSSFYPFQFNTFIKSKFSLYHKNIAKININRAPHFLDRSYYKEVDILFKSGLINQKEDNKKDQDIPDEYKYLMKKKTAVTLRMAIEEQFKRDKLYKILRSIRI